MTAGRPGAALLAVAHGTRDQAGADTMRELVARIRAARPGARVAMCWLGLRRPSVTDALAGRERGTVVVPLLLGTGYHLRADLPALLSDADDVLLARALGPDPLLARALAVRLAQAGRPPGPTPVVLAAAGSSEVRAIADTQEAAGLLAHRLGAPVVPAYLSGARTRPAEAVAALRAAGHRDVAVASYLLAPGFFADRLSAAGARWTARPLGALDMVAHLVWERFDEVSRCRTD